jgi:SAM-dependent methyltransferase
MLSRWLSTLESRHLADLTFSEVARALRALSSTYVERRERLTKTGAFDSAGKRAAYALYYSPLHVLTVAHIVQGLDLATHPPRHLLDLGCGTGAAGAAWGSSVSPQPRITGLDERPWALSEAALTYRAFGFDAETMRGDAARVRLPRSVDAVIAGWVINELEATARAALQRNLLDAATRGVAILIVEPIATRTSPWWSEWTGAFDGVGARADEWRFRVELPDFVKRLGQAAGLRQEALTARSLVVMQAGRQVGRSAGRGR